MSGCFRIASARPFRQAACCVLAGTFALTLAQARPAHPKTLILPLQPCRELAASCHLGPDSKPGQATRAAEDPSLPAVPVPHAPTRNPSGSHLVVRHLSAKGLALDGLVTPERLLSALAYELRSGCHTAEGTPRPCTQMTVLVDGKNWHPGGIFGYTLAAIPSRWIRRVDVLENAPADPPPGGEAATSGDPSVVDVILHRFLFSGEASVAAGVDEGGGAFSGGNAEDYNILLNAQDRNGDSFLLDFNYERFYGPVWYGYPPGAIVVPNTVYPGPDSFQETPGSGTPFGGRMRPPPSKQDPSGGGRFIWQHPLPR